MKVQQHNNKIYFYKRTLICLVQKYNSKKPLLLSLIRKLYLIIKIFIIKKYLHQKFMLYMNLHMILNGDDRRNLNNLIINICDYLIINDEK